MDEKEFVKEISKVAVEEERDQLISFYSQSIEPLEKAISIKPDSPNIANIWNNLGVAYIQKGDKDKGAECFKKAEELQNQ